MTTPTVHPYSLRARTGKAVAMKSPADAASVSDHEDPNPSTTLSTGLTTHRRYSDVVLGQFTSPAPKGGQSLADKPSDEGSAFEDLVTSADKGNASDEQPPAPDRNLTRWVQDNPNTKRTTVYTRENRSLDSLLDTNLAKAEKPGNTSGEDSPEPREKARVPDPVAVAEEQLTATQKEQIER